MLMFFLHFAVFNLVVNENKRRIQNKKNNKFAQFSFTYRNINNTVCSYPVATGRFLAFCVAYHRCQ